MANKDETGVQFMPSTLETIDTSIHKYIEEYLNLHVMTNRGFAKVPVIWVGAERTYQMKHDLNLRDKEGLLKLPLITLERKEVTKNPSKSPVPGNVPDLGLGGWIPVSTRINQKKTGVFKAAQNSKKQGPSGSVGNVQRTIPSSRDKLPTNISPMFDTRPVNQKDKVVYETTFIPVPVYVEVKYEISLRSEYLQQMNTMVTPFISGHTKIGRNKNYFLLQHDNHRFEAFVDGSFATEGNSATLEEEERIFNTTISINVLGYLIGAEKNERLNNRQTYENIVEVKMSRERVVFEEEPTRENRSGSKPFYKE